MRSRSKVPRKVACHNLYCAQEIPIVRHMLEKKVLLSPGTKIKHCTMDYTAVWNFDTDSKLYPLLDTNLTTPKSVSLNLQLFLQPYSLH
jgi:hypothetical protein